MCEPKLHLLGDIYITISLNTFPTEKNEPGTKSATKTSAEIPIEPIPSSSGQAIRPESTSGGNTEPAAATMDILDDPLLSPRAVRQTEKTVAVPAIATDSHFAGTEMTKQGCSVTQW